MLWLYILLGALVLLVATILGVSYYCFRRIFYNPPRRPLGEDEYEIPEGDIYEPFREGMVEWMKQTRQMPHEDVSIVTSDGLKLVGKYYEFKKGAPIEILFHGYKGNGERDMGGGIERCFKVKRNCIIVDQRACGMSEGNVTTFGIKERHDALAWVNFVLTKFGSDTEIILSGVSMGAATVMMATGEPLPDNVVCVLADCGYTSPREIIKKVINEMKLPADLVFPFVKLGGIIFGHFNIDETSALKCMKKCTVPIIFIHGENDDFVPAEMSERLYQACVSTKTYLPVPNAGHGLAFPVDKDGYIQAVNDFEKKWRKSTNKTSK